MHVVPVLSDNFCYLVVDTATNEAAAVDPVEVDRVLAAASAAGVTITKVLTTHKHWDHAGGNKDMLKALPECEIVGSTVDDVGACTRPVDYGDTIALGTLSITCLATPGHTRGSLCFNVQARAPRRAAFSPATLCSSPAAAGCSRARPKRCGRPSRPISSRCRRTRGCGSATSTPSPT